MYLLSIIYFYVSNPSNILIVSIHLPHYHSSTVTIHQILTDYFPNNEENVFYISKYYFYYD